MNAVEIEESVSEIIQKDFNPSTFPYQFLESFGNKITTLKKLKSGSTNKSDLGGVLLRNNIHILICKEGDIDSSLNKLKNSNATIKFKVKFILATDGKYLASEDINSGETIACEFIKFPDYFGFFLPLAGISTVKEIRENSFDIKATGRLNKLYLELLKTNQEWASKEKINQMNHFMARLIFCFFAEDTQIFGSNISFTNSISQMSNSDSSNTHEIIQQIFRSMNTTHKDRDKSNLPRWASKFPYVNGGLFSEDFKVPLFSKIARSYLINIGNLDWTKINPDIFGSMVQAVTEKNDRGSLGLHYTSVPNILKTLNPLFLNKFREILEKVGNNPIKLKNLRKRISKVLIFDPACGSGNFLVIAYKELREIEDEINRRLNQLGKKSEISITNFRGIEIKNFASDIARLALVIAEFQSNVIYLGQKEALNEFLPLSSKNWIKCANALKEDWNKIIYDDQGEILDNSTSIEKEIYVCGNPPYLGSTWQSKTHKEDLNEVFKDHTKLSKSLDYVSGWFMKAAQFCQNNLSSAAFVSTNSICQGQHVPILWPLIYKFGCNINFAYSSFKWKNLASHNAGVIVIIVGITTEKNNKKFLYNVMENEQVMSKEVKNINSYLVPGQNLIIEKALTHNSLSPMLRGNMPTDGGNLLLSLDELNELNLSNKELNKFTRRIYGSAEFIRGKPRYCLWIEDRNLDDANNINSIKERIEKVKEMRLASRDKGANAMADYPHQMREMNIGKKHAIVIPCVSSDNRPYLPAGLIDNNSTITNLCFALFDAPIWNLSILLSRLHLVWIKTICGRLGNGLRYSNTMGWNTFPIPILTQKNKEDMERCASNIMLTRELYFPSSISELYDSGNMPKDLEEAHLKNDEIIERIYLGREFKNDSERLEKLFDLYKQNKLIK